MFHRITSDIIISYIICNDITYRNYRLITHVHATKSN